MIHLFFPEGRRVVQPALRHCAGAQPEAVSQSRIDVKLRGCAQLAEQLQPPLHQPPAGNAVAVAHAGIGGRVKLAVFAVAGVLQDDGGRPR